MVHGYPGVNSHRKIVLQNIINAQFQPINHRHGQKENYWRFLVHRKRNQKVTQVFRLNPKDFIIVKKRELRIFIKLKKCRRTSDGPDVFVKTALLQIPRFLVENQRKLKELSSTDKEIVLFQRKIINFLSKK